MLGFSGPNEWMIILLVVVIIFGGKKIPELMGGIGKGVKSFKKGLNEPIEEAEKLKDETKEAIEEEKKA